MSMQAEEVQHAAFKDIDVWLAGRRPVSFLLLLTLAPHGIDESVGGR